MIAVEAEQVQALQIGEMGVKQVKVGDATLYTRQGSYFYLEFNTKEQ